MATEREIKSLLKKVQITIDVRDAICASNNLNQVHNMNINLNEPNVEEFLLKNAEYIDFKKLLVITVKRLQELVEQYKSVSRILEENNRKELQEAIKFAKTYISPDEMVKLCKIDYTDDETFILYINSNVSIYGKELENKNPKYDKIADVLPNIDIDVEESKQMLGTILEDENVGTITFINLLYNTLINEGYEIDVDDLFKSVYLQKEDAFYKLIDKNIFNQCLRQKLEELKVIINTDKYILFHAERLNKKLENKEELTQQEIEFLNQLERIAKDIDKKTSIKLDKKVYFGKKEIDKFLSKWNREKGQYVTEKQLATGEKLLIDMNGYEDYCSKNELRELAKIEQNLLYLAQRKKLSNSDIYNIAVSYPISEDTLVGLYQCDAFNLKRVEKYAKQQGMNFEEIKEKMKQNKIQDDKDIDLMDDEIWDLLTQKERLKVVVTSIDNGKGEEVQERIKEIYHVQDIANLYKEIYDTKNQEEEQTQEFEEKREQYNDLLKLHNALGLENTDDIVNLLEDELSNEMLTNLYSDNIIGLDVLESYGEKELVIEVFYQGKLHNHDVKRAIIQYAIPIEAQQVWNYYQEGVFTTRDILDLYIQARITLDSMRKMNEKLPEEQKIDLELQEKELANLYQDVKKKKKRKNITLDTTMKYKRYGLLYQTLKRENLDENGKIDSDKKILEHMTDITQEDIIELYKDNLLTLDTVLIHGGDELVKKLAFQGELRTNDSRRYFASEEENTKIEELLQNPEMDEAEKLILIYTTYGDNAKKREKLVEAYLPTYATDIKGEETASREKKQEQDKKDKKSTITDPYERWRLLALLDKNYSRKYVGGYLIVKLHNTQKVIIEKLYGKKHGQIEAAKDTATFGLSIEEYEKLEPELIRSKKFDIAKIRKLARQNPEEITKITHHSARYDEEGNEKNSWGKRLLEFVCDDKLPKVYSEEEIAQISECSKAIERSRKEIDR